MKADAILNILKSRKKGKKRSDFDDKKIKSINII